MNRLVGGTYMKNQWLNFFSGSVKVHIQGRGIERFINTCMRHGIQIWKVKKHEDHTASFYMLLKDVSKIRLAARGSECKLYFVGRSGMPFLIKKTLLNSGVLVGAFLFLLLLFLVSNMVWSIQVKGAKPETEHLLLKELKKMGIERGAFQFMIDDPETIQRKLTDNIEAITWVGVELKGTTFYFQVVEKNQPEQPEEIGVRHLVAKKKAVITNMFIEEGQPLVSVNDHVSKGQILVSAFIGKEGQTKTVPARGKIFGETWYKSTVVLPLQTTFRVFTGNYYEKHFISFKNISLPVWGFKKPTFSKYEMDLQKTPLRFWRFELPIFYERVIYREKEQVTRSYSWEEAFQKAKEMARQELLEKLEEDSTIKGEKILHQAKENGKVRIEIHYQVIENIGIPQPIIQGD
jgi:similar to stage IV sporulation protein